MVESRAADKGDVITVKHFKMDFGDKHVIKDLSFEVKRGEVFGLLGSNGSGKTTTLRALFGVYKPTSGELLVDGAPYRVDSGIKLGYLPEERGLYRKETVADAMRFLGQLKGMSRQEANQYIKQYLERVKMTEYVNTRLDKLSGGQQQKIQLGVALMNDPELLVLDEPTKGFDPVNCKLLMQLIMESRERGATIVMISHQMEDVEHLCDRVLLLKNGVAEAYGTPEEVEHKYGEKSLRDVFIKVYEGDKDDE